MHLSANMNYCSLIHRRVRNIQIEKAIIVDYVFKRTDFFNVDTYSDLLDFNI